MPFAPEQVLGYAPELKERFQSGAGMREWYERYRGILFDDDDLRLAESQSGHHFYEWLGAVVMHQATGYHCLLQKYQFAAHPQKQEVLARLVPPPLAAIFDGQVSRGEGGNRMQGPDLLMYAPDESVFFFCEIKGPNDDLRPKQVRFFESIAEATGQRIELLRFYPFAPRAV